MKKLPKEIIELDTKRVNRPIIIKYSLEIFTRKADGEHIVAYTNNGWKECLELCEGENAEEEMKYRLTHHCYNGKKLNFKNKINTIR